MVVRHLSDIDYMTAGEVVSSKVTPWEYCFHVAVVDTAVAIVQTELCFFPHRLTTTNKPYDLQLLLFSSIVLIEEDSEKSGHPIQSDRANEAASMVFLASHDFSLISCNRSWTVGRRLM